MGSFTLNISATALFAADAPTLEILLDGVVVDSDTLSSGSNSLSYTIAYTGAYPDSIYFRFTDASGEKKRSITLDSVELNGVLLQTKAVNGQNEVKRKTPDNTLGHDESLALDTKDTDVQNALNTNDPLGAYDPETGPLSSDFGDAHVTANPGGQKVSGVKQNSDVIQGSSGDDDIRGEQGDDRIAGGDGNDRLLGHDGNDIILGGNGDDLLSGGNGDDMLYGNDGNDKIYGGDGNDTLSGLAGNDILYGNAGDDVIYGGDGKDQLYGLEDNDTLYGGNGRDTLDGGDGDDTLYGGADNDFLQGGNGNDILDGGDGADYLRGGEQVEINLSGLIAYSSGQDTSVPVHYLQDNAGVELDGNLWKRLVGSYTITADTVLEFDYRSGVMPEIAAIGFDNDNNHSNDSHRFFIYGDQASGLNYAAPRATYQYDGSGDWVHYEIPVGTYFTGTFTNLTFINDDDGPGIDGESWYVNLVLHEGGEGTNLLYGGLGKDDLYGSGGADTFVFESGSAFENRDVIHYFSPGDGDAIDISALLSGFNGSSDINDYVSVSNSGDHSIVSVDVDGAGGAGFRPIAEIRGLVDLDVDTLYANGNIIA